MSKCSGHDQQVEMTRVLELIKSKGLRLTQQRKTLIEVLLKFRVPFSADDLKEELSDTKIDLATIYRALQSFQDLGLLQRIDFNDGVARYEYQNESHHHHHIVCTECRKVEVVDFCVVKGQEELIRKMGYQDVFHKLEFFGVCKDCIDKQSAD